MYLAGVSFSYFGDALFIELAYFFADISEKLVGFRLRQFSKGFIFFAVHPEVGEFLLFLFREVLAYPIRIVPPLVTPNERVTVDSYAAAVAVLDYRIRRGSAPVRLFFWVFAVVPIFFSIPVFLDKAGAVGLHFKLFPVEGDCRRVEEFSVQVAVFLIAFV